MWWGQRVFGVLISNRDTGYGGRLMGRGAVGVCERGVGDGVVVTVKLVVTPPLPPPSTPLLPLPLLPALPPQAISSLPPQLDEVRALLASAGAEEEALHATSLFWAFR